MSLTFVNALTSGTTTSEIAIAATPISGDFAAAAGNPELSEMTSVEMPTVRRPERMPAYAPIFVIFFEKRPQIYGPMKQPETRPQEKDIRLTMIGIFLVAKMKEHATNTRQRILVRII